MDKRLWRALCDEKDDEIVACTNEISGLELLLNEAKAKRARLKAELDALVGTSHRSIDDAPSASTDQTVLTVKKARLIAARDFGTQTEDSECQCDGVFYT